MMPKVGTTWYLTWVQAGSPAWDVRSCLSKMGMYGMLKWLRMFDMDGGSSKLEVEIVDLPLGFRHRTVSLFMPMR